MPIEPARRTRGFTLIELLIVAAIIAVLAALALPAYGRYAHRARRAEGKELLLRIAHAQERYYATYHRYGGLVDLGFADPAPSAKGYYQATVVLPAGERPQSYTATAHPLLSQKDDACGALALDDTGKRTSSSDDDASSNGVCW
jgi:type IV pilus assembly protein PilE